MQINLTGPVVAQLLSFKNKLQKELGVNPRWNTVLKRLLDVEKDVRGLKSKIKSKETKINKMHDKTESYLIMALERPSSPVMAMQQNNSPSIGLPPPPPPMVAASPLPLIIDVKVSEKLEKDFINELKQAVGGKPSEILKLTGAHEDNVESLEDYERRKEMRKNDPVDFGTEYEVR